MRQNITKKQLMELVGKQDDVLYKWCKGKGYLTKEHSIPLLTIGQMIEFLGNDWFDMLLEVNKLKENWFNSPEIPIDILCDYCWKAIKYELKENNKE